MKTFTDAPASIDGAGTGSIESAIGGTPLVRLRGFESKPGVELYAKLESRNPGGSVKDRAALAMIREGERTGALGPGRILLDATSGNTGIAYAMLGAARGYRVRLCVPANITPERKRLLQAYGADLILTDPMLGTDGAIREARQLHAAAPGRYFYPDQYSNSANWRAHYDTTALEIWHQTGGSVSHFVAGLGTSGTFIGTGRRLRELTSSITLVSVQPDSPLHALEGLKHMASALVPAIYDPELADLSLTVTTEDALDLTRRLARDEGLFVGPSSGAALSASLKIIETMDRGVLVTIFPDGGDRYLSERFWTEEDDAMGPEPRGTLRVSSAALAQIHTHAAASYPDECCGALLGVPGEAESALPLDNVTGGERRRRFLISPDAYRRAEAEADRSARQLLGFYHSHPDHPAEPSAFDLEHAWPNLSYVIVSVRNRRIDDLRSWRLRSDRSQFDEEPLR